MRHLYLNSIHYTYTKIMLDTYLHLLSQLHESDQQKLEETQGQIAEVLKNSRETTRLLNESLSQIAALQKQLAEMMRKIDEKDKVIITIL